MKAAKVLGASFNDDSAGRPENSLDIDFSDVALAPGEGPPPIPLRSSSGAPAVAGVDAVINSSKEPDVAAQLSVDPPLHHASKHQEISPFLFQQHESDGRRPDLQTRTSNVESSSASGSGSSRFLAQQPGPTMRPATPPMAASASQLSLASAATPVNARRSKNPLKFFRKKSTATLREGEASPSSTPRLPTGTPGVSSSGFGSRIDVRDSSAVGLDEELNVDEHDIGREAKKGKLIGRPRTRDKDSKRSRTLGGSTGDAERTESRAGSSAQRGQPSVSNDIPLALDTNFDKIDDIVDTSIRQPSLVGPLDETLTPSDGQLFGRKPGSPTSPTSPRYGRDRSTSVSFIEQQKTAASSTDSPYRPTGSLRRLATASGSTFPQTRPILQPPRADLSDPRYQKMSKAEAQAFLSTRLPATSSPSLVDSPLEGKVVHDGVTFLAQRPAALFDSNTLVPENDIRDERKASYASTSSRMTSESDISPTTSVGNIGKLSARGIPSEQRPSGQGVDTGYKFPPTSRGNADPRKSSASSAKITSSWMAPDSWAVQADKIRDALRDEDDEGNDDGISTRIDPLNTSPSYKRDAGRLSLTASLWTGTSASSLPHHTSTSSSPEGAQASNVTAPRDSTQSRRETLDSTTSMTSSTMDREGGSAKGDAAPLEILQPLPPPAPFSAPLSHAQHQSAASSPAHVRPSSRGGSTIGNAAAAAVGKLGLHRPSRIKMNSRPNTAGSVNVVQVPAKGLPSTPTGEEDVSNVWKMPKRSQPPAKHPYMRVYKDDGTHSVVSISLDSTATDLRAILARKSVDPAQVCRLFVRDKGSERPLGELEKPAMLQRRRLEQAGYTEADSLEEIGREDLSFLLKFVFRPDRVTTFDSYSFGNTETDFNVLDLRNRNLEMVPIFMYKHAEWIKSLDLGGNPMHDIPLDFIQLCSNLSTLCLSHLSLKRIPQSIRHAVRLTHLDLSDNRILDLAHINLSNIPQLMSLKAQNNRLADLPSYFGKMQYLHDLNVSNNRFEVFPSVVCQLSNLRQLDISFNTISELPSELSELNKLQRLILVGNSLVNMPATVGKMDNLQAIDLRRNLLQNVSPLFSLPCLEELKCEHNSIKHLDVTFGKSLKKLEIGQNPLSKATFHAQDMCSLTTLNLSSANMGKLDDAVLGHLPNLTELVLDRNNLVVLPDNLGQLSQLTRLSCTNNILATLPDSLGQLGNLTELLAHNNNLKSLPPSVWHCGNLHHINVSSNLLESFPQPSAAGSTAAGVADSMANSGILPPPESRKGSAGSLGPVPSAVGVASRASLPLSSCLRKLRLGDNNLTEDIFPLLSNLPELQVLNLSSNDLYEIPTFGLSHLVKLRELYLSGNSLGSIPAEELPLLKELRILHVNGNKLQTLPAELGKVANLVNLDVGNNSLKYNISNQQYDWNWNSNPNLRYLNLSGNKRLEIKSNPIVVGTNGPSPHSGWRRTDSSDFQRLTNLRLLGLMDVTVTLHQMPDEYDDRRVRTSLSQINQMSYGISDALGQHEHLSIVDVVVPRFRKRENECLFGLFAGRCHGDKIGSRIAFHLAQWVNFRIQWEVQRLQPQSHLVPPDFDKVEDIIRRSFLRMQKEYADVLISEGARQRPDGTTLSGKDSNKTEAFIGTETLSSVNWRSGASAVLAYVVDRTLFVANCGDSLAVLSRNSSAHLVSTKHEPFDRNETLRIRSAEGWVSLQGQVNDTLDVSRSFGHYHLAPIVNAAPAVQRIEMTDSDEFVILANNTLWDFIPYQTAVDIARMERDDPMLAAQKLRDYAISYGAEDSIMVMVVAVGDLFQKARGASRGQGQTLNGGTSAGVAGQGTEAGAPIFESPWDFKKANLRRGREFIPGDRTLARLQREVPPPVGQVALVFTDIRNSTSLWETNAGMQSAMRLHNFLLRRQLRNIGGYEVKTEGDAFMVSFQTVTSALLWCFQVQIQLLKENWPQEILESEDGKEIYDENTGELLYRGLSVRMGIHWGWPVCEADPITRRMDYFGPMVNRASRIEGAAEGGQILASRDVINELRAIMGTFDDERRRPYVGGDVPSSPVHAELDGSSEEDAFRLLNPNVSRDVVLLRRMGFAISDVGERRLKGLEVPEHLSLVYPKSLTRRFVNLIEPATAVRPASLLVQSTAVVADGKQPDLPSQALVPNIASGAEAISAQPPVEVFEPTMHLLSVDEVKMVCYLCLRLEALAQGAIFIGIEDSITANMSAGRQSRPDSSILEPSPEQASVAGDRSSRDATVTGDATSMRALTAGQVHGGAQMAMLPLSSPRQMMIESYLNHHPELMLSGIRDDATDEELYGVLSELTGRICIALSTLAMRKFVAHRAGSIDQLGMGVDIIQIVDMLQAIGTGSQAAP